MQIVFGDQWTSSAVRGSSGDGGASVSGAAGSARGVTTGPPEAEGGLPGSAPVPPASLGGVQSALHELKVGCLAPRARRTARVPAALSLFRFLFSLSHFLYSICRYPPRKCCSTLRKRL